MDEGKLWSLIRNVLSQGGAIQLDRASMSGYEEYSARLDAAASDRVAEFAKLADTRIAELEAALARQSAAVRMLDMSHVARAETMMQHAKVLHDQSNTAALESERSANALLTERVAELEAALEVARRDAERYRWIAKFPTYTRCIEYAGFPATKDNIVAEYKQWSFAGPLAYMLKGDSLGEAIDAARAGNGGEG